MIGILGAQPRFILGAVLVAARLLWMKRHKMLDTARVKARKERDASRPEVMRDTRDGPEQALDRRALHVALAPNSILRRFFNSFHPGTAG